MPHKLKAAIDEWRMADANARAAEGMLAQAWEKHLQDGSDPPAELHAGVQRLRKEANDKLTAARELMKSG